MKKITNYTVLIHTEYGFNIYRYYYMLHASESERKLRNKNYENSLIVEVCDCELDDCLFKSKLTFIDEIKCIYYYYLDILKSKF